MSIFDGSSVRHMEPVAVSQADAARMLRISDRTLRRWEDRGLIEGRRNNNGVKLYPVKRVRELAGEHNG